MKLHLVYLSIGVLTLLLNLFLSLHIVRKHKGKGKRGTMDCEEIITFRLTGNNSTEGNTTEAVLYDDTVALQ